MLGSPDFGRKRRIDVLRWQWMSRKLLLLAAFALVGCRGVPTTIESYSLPTPPEGIVIVADGSGGYQIAPKAIAMAVEAARLPLYVRSFDWTHGTGRGLADMLDIENSREQGARLASEVDWYRTNYPNLPMFLVGHSAGCNIILEASRSLRPGRVDKIVLLAPAVSADYDLRQALAVSRCGIDVFTSEKDVLVLGVATKIVGNADGGRGDAAGRVGFEERPEYEGRLRQHAWDPSVAWTGNLGGHSDSLMRSYLRVYVLPLLTPCPCPR
jgi:pimeloyl-ACP methyl ester carboxylesterase